MSSTAEQVWQLLQKVEEKSPECTTVDLSKALCFEEVSGKDTVSRLCAALASSASVVQSLDLSYNGLGEKDAETIARMLKRNQSIRTLDLSGNFFGISALKNLRDALLVNVTLVFLFIQNQTNDLKNEKEETTYKELEAELARLIQGNVSIHKVTNKDSSELDLSNRRQTEFNRNIVVRFPHLQSLILSNNKLRQIPECIAELQHLRVLDLSRNKLTKLPTSLWRCRELRTLDVSHNRLSVLPLSLSMLPRLQRIEFEGNQRKKDDKEKEKRGSSDSSATLSSSSSGKSTKRRGGSSVIALASSLSPMSSPTTTPRKTSNNKQNNKEKEKGEKEGASSSTTTTNEGEDEQDKDPEDMEQQHVVVPPELVKAGGSALICWLREMAKGSQETYHLSVMAVGPVGAGKSSLLEYLFNPPSWSLSSSSSSSTSSPQPEPAEEEKPQHRKKQQKKKTPALSSSNNKKTNSALTHTNNSNNINFGLPKPTQGTVRRQYHVPKASISKQFPSNDVTVTALDCSQELLSTELLMNERTIFLLCFPLSDCNEELIEESLRLIWKQTGGVAPVLLVGTHVDLKACSSSQTKKMGQTLFHTLSLRYPNICEFSRVCCRHPNSHKGEVNGSIAMGKGITSLRRRIFEIGQQHEWLPQQVPSSFFAFNKVLVTRLEQQQQQVLEEERTQPTQYPILHFTEAIQIFDSLQKEVHEKEDAKQIIAEKEDDDGETEQVQQTKEKNGTNEKNKENKASKLTRKNVKEQTVFTALAYLRSIGSVYPLPTHQLFLLDPAFLSLCLNESKDTLERQIITSYSLLPPTTPSQAKAQLRQVQEHALKLEHEMTVLLQLLQQPLSDDEEGNGNIPISSSSSSSSSTPSSPVASPSSSAVEGKKTEIKNRRTKTRSLSTKSFRLKRVTSRKTTVSLSTVASHSSAS
ncbi:Myotubularin-like phosphatase domain [Balamuthia mandrillaris]